MQATGSAKAKARRRSPVTASRAATRRQTFATVPVARVYAVQFRQQPHHRRTTH